MAEKCQDLRMPACMAEECQDQECQPQHAWLKNARIKNASMHSWRIPGLRMPACISSLRSMLNFLVRGCCAECIVVVQCMCSPGEPHTCWYAILEGAHKGLYKNYEDFIEKRDLPMQYQELSYVAAKFWCKEDAKNFVQAELWVLLWKVLWVWRLKNKFPW